MPSVSKNALFDNYSGQPGTGHRKFIIKASVSFYNSRYF